MVDKIPKARNPKRNIHHQSTLAMKDLDNVLKNLSQSMLKQAYSSYYKHGKATLINFITTAFPTVKRDMLLMGTHIISSFTPTEIIYWMRS
jgi:hypothetical protein